MVKVSNRVGGGRKQSASIKQLADFLSSLHTGSEGNFKRALSKIFSAVVASLVYIHSLLR